MLTSKYSQYLTSLVVIVEQCVVLVYSVSDRRLTAEVARLSRIWQILDGEVSKALRKRGAGQAGEEPDDDNSSQ